jgi:hypothetical protein
MRDAGRGTRKAEGGGRVGKSSERGVVVGVVVYWAPQYRSFCLSQFWASSGFLGFAVSPACALVLGLSGRLFGLFIVVQHLFHWLSSLPMPRLINSIHRPLTLRFWASTVLSQLRSGFRLATATYLPGLLGFWAHGAVLDPRRLLRLLVLS